METLPLKGVLLITYWRAHILRNLFKLIAALCVLPVDCEETQPRPRPASWVYTDTSH